MVNALFDPDVFLASDEIWNCLKRRHIFLDQLDKHLAFVDYLGVAQILWCDDYDLRLWSHPQRPPWRADRGWDIRLSQILYRNLTKHCRRLDISQLAPAECQPSVQCSCSSANSTFLRLINAVFNNSLTCHYCPSQHNIINQNHRFRPNSEASWSQFQEVNGPEDWPKKIQPAQMFWPRNRTDTGRFAKCIELVALSKDVTLSTLQKHSFTQRFLADLVPASRKERIVEMIVHRLSLSLQDAARDPQLQDEQLASGPRRFRVTPRPSSLRVHYEIHENQIVFSRFFDEGHHDDGL